MILPAPGSWQRWLPIAYRRRRSLTAGEQTALYLAALFVVCLAFFALLWPHSEMAAAQYEIAAAKARYQEILIVNAELRVQIGQAANMDALEARAKAAGFTAPTRREFVTLPNAPAGSVTQNQPAK